MTETHTRSATEMLEAWLGALGRLDVEEATALFAADAAFKVPLTPAGLPPRIDGREQIGQVLGMIGQMFTSLDFSDVEVHATDDPDLAIASAHGDAVLADGDPYTQDYIFWVRAREGEIVEYREYMDPIRAAAAIAMLSG